MSPLLAEGALATPVSGAFVMLVGPDKAEELEQSLGQLYDNVLAEHPRPVILFYGDDVDEEERYETGQQLGSPESSPTCGGLKYACCRCCVAINTEYTRSLHFMGPHAPDNVPAHSLHCCLCSRSLRTRLTPNDALWHALSPQWESCRLRSWRTL